MRRRRDGANYEPSSHNSARWRKRAANRLGDLYHFSALHSFVKPTAWQSHATAASSPTDMPDVRVIVLGPNMRLMEVKNVIDCLQGQLTIGDDVESENGCTQNAAD